MKNKRFQFCEVCRRNHDQSRAHVYSSRHRENLKKILNKFEKKIQECKPFLKDVEVVDGEAAGETCFWCYFCATEFQRHVVCDQLVVLYASMFEHLSCENHITAASKYFKRHNVEANLMDNFIISEKSITKFKSKLRDILLAREQAEAKRTKDEIKEIKKADDRNAMAACASFPEEPARLMYRTVTNYLGILQNPTGWHEGRRVWGGGIVRYKKPGQWIPWELDEEGLPTGLVEGIAGRIVQESATSQAAHEQLTGRYVTAVPAAGEKMTAISRPTHMIGRANVHDPDSIPPWMQNDDEEDGTGGEMSAGPSVMAFRLSQLAKKRKTSNPMRVGADFDR
eukprot:Ihof_evm19s11 gene=Ihof_evmTU19s11